MVDRSRHSGIDHARFVAAIFVIAIHTSPFSSVPHIGNTLALFTRTTGRLAVPFFLMTTGYYLFPGQSVNILIFKKFLIKLFCLYGFISVVYLPILICTGYFQADGIFLTVLKDAVFNGTFYHLWYLPAVILGVILVAFFIKYLPSKISAMLCVVLYVIGLLGDAYYGFTETIPAIAYFYRQLFYISDFTRNGIFFAPLFLLLGSQISRYTTPLTPCRKFGFSFFYFLLIAEAIVTSTLQLQRHDCMYLFLVPAAYYLFQLVLDIKAKYSRHIKNIATNMYLFHPLIMIVIRSLSKRLAIDKFIISNSFLYFTITLLTSIGIGYIVSSLDNIINERIRQHK